MTTKVTFESTTAMGLIDDIRAFLALVDGDGADDAAEAATGTGASGASTRKKRETKAEKEARLAAEQAAVAQAATGAPQPTFTPPGTTATAQAQPAPAFGQSPAPAFGQAGGAPTAAPELHPIAKAIIDVVDKSIAGGQPPENVIGFFRSQIGPDAANATLDQIKQVFIPRMPEAQLRTIAPMVGLSV